MLSDTQIERYSRQIILPQVGGRGQERLLSAGAVIAADGDASSIVAAYLSAAGIGRLAIVDLGPPPNAISSDRADATERLPFTPLQLEALNPDCATQQLSPPHTGDEAFAMADRYDVVIVAEARPLASAVAVDGTALFNAACVDLRKPLIWARVDGVVGCMTRLAGEHASAPCYQCLLPQLARLVARDVSAPWVSTLTASVIGSVQATEAIKILLGLDATLPGRLLTWNWLSTAIQERRIVRDARCTTCSATARLRLRAGPG